MSTATAHLTPHQAGDLEAHVESVSLGLQSLAVLLIRERQALTERASADVLDNIAQDKQGAVANVAGLYSLLRDALESLSEDGADFADSVAALKDAQPHLASRVDELVELTRECQLANQENGILVNARLRGTRGVLDSLHEAEMGAGVPGTYSPVGSSFGSMAGDRFTVRA